MTEKEKQELIEMGFCLLTPGSLLVLTMTLANMWN